VKEERGLSNQKGKRGRNCRKRTKIGGEERKSTADRNEAEIQGGGVPQARRISSGPSRSAKKRRGLHRH